MFEKEYWAHNRKKMRIGQLFNLFGERQRKLHKETMHEKRKIMKTQKKNYFKSFERETERGIGVEGSEGKEIWRFSTEKKT